MELLTERRFLRRLTDGRYGIGPAMITLAVRAADQFDLAQIARPHLVSLSTQFDQTVHLAELQGNDIVYVDKVDPSRRSIRLTSRIGQPVPLHTASVAKAILAFQPAEVRATILRDHGFERFTTNTITSLDAFDLTLSQVRERGWAMDDGEREDYINALGAPIRDASGAVVAAVSSIELRSVQDLGEMEHDVLPALLAAADAISLELGWAPEDGGEDDDR
ncbi:IclR family transcriptional regulator [Microbacterium oryzae]|uniref:IclR family transcriptional regulator n=1 Tax=Microbacterium oryzae TaxID=743009 RepID=UPI0025B21EA8|nr:IclR family transcriptional regulator [Microbacterium oryzae]MDN3312016.1 IclR family transcriptional regulator [Microbacterium oryzae]